MMSVSVQPVSALTIAGSDSGGGAGIQADLKTFAAHGVHGLSAIAALTAQHTRGVTAIHTPPLEFLRAQLDACFDDFNIHAVKIGMLANSDVIDTVADALETYTPAVVILDPVMVSTSGARLLEESAYQALRTRLIPLATLITPNIPEAEWLLEMQISRADDAELASELLLRLGPQAVLLKGAHLNEGKEVIDRYRDAEHTRTFTHQRMQLEGHGTGCTLSSAITANCCLGLALDQACENGIAYVQRALQLGYHPGKSEIMVLNHIAAADNQHA